MSNPFINNQPTFGYQGAQARLNARGSMPSRGADPSAYSAQQGYLNPLITTPPNIFQNAYDTSFMNPFAALSTGMGSDPFASIMDLLPDLINLLVGSPEGDATNAGASASVTASDSVTTEAEFNARVEALLADYDIDGADTSLESAESSATSSEDDVVERVLSDVNDRIDSEMNEIRGEINSMKEDLAAIKDYIVQDSEAVETTEPADSAGGTEGVDETGSTEEADSADSTEETDDAEAEDLGPTTTELLARVETPSVFDKQIRLKKSGRPRQVFDSPDLDGKTIRFEDRGGRNYTSASMDDATVLFAGNANDNRFHIGGKNNSVIIDAVAVDGDNTDYIVLDGNPSDWGVLKAGREGEHNVVIMHNDETNNVVKIVLSEGHSLNDLNEKNGMVRFGDASDDLDGPAARFDFSDLENVTFSTT